MPPLPAKPCRWPGCPKLCTDGSGYCQDHIEQARAKKQRQRQDRDTRQSAARRGYDRRWARVRALKLRRDPVCERCGKKIANVVHHLVPIEVDYTKRLEYDNLQSLCRECHEIVHKRKKA
jgi:5-methylcytosine-specific restriction protein A